ncbi:DUF4956 domain-containing protein [Nocardiopsis exhalans]|uniref:DUF4956 domain-containing protein n=2 Tax=Nocardiopsis TaxID=2013 RepID=A0A840WD49_9ACTN|nr:MULTISPECIES: DUF4956 domain-containing protein [Nocardiopsis]MBB5494064.1 hypothetical protein [Nocardiopsis metallicus]QRN81278.1 MAG: DUF4956 domain-containing protein [Nocardiopsis sp. BM-2018]USY23111.1 DUF4956 domain-containing protein [Nocardiopsis exhalans]
MFFFALAVDLTAITVLSYALYFRRHGRRDLVLAYVALNVGIFAVVSMLAQQEVGLAVGFGLFGVLSILRLRSDLISQGEIGYYFVAIALGLVNAVAAPMPWLVVGLNALLLSALYLAGHPKLLARTQRRIMTLDVVHEDPVALRQDLEGRLRGRVRHVDVTEVDYVRDLMVVDVRFQEPKLAEVPGTAAERRQPMPAWWGAR